MCQNEFGNVYKDASNQTFIPLCGAGCDYLLGLFLLHQTDSGGVLSDRSGWVFPCRTFGIADRAQGGEIGDPKQCGISEGLCGVRSADPGILCYGQFPSGLWETAREHGDQYSDAGHQCGAGFPADRGLPSGSHGSSVSIAFGPGLTLTMFLGKRLDVFYITCMSI